MILYYGLNWSLSEMPRDSVKSGHSDEGEIGQIPHCYGTYFGDVLMPECRNRMPLARERRRTLFAFGEVFRCHALSHCGRVFTHRIFQEEIL